MTHGYQQLHWARILMWIFFLLAIIALLWTLVLYIMAPCSQDLAVWAKLLAGPMALFWFALVLGFAAIVLAVVPGRMEGCADAPSHQQTTPMVTNVVSGPPLVPGWPSSTSVRASY